MTRGISENGRSIDKSLSDATSEIKRGTAKGLELHK